MISLKESSLKCMAMMSITMYINNLWVNELLNSKTMESNNDLINEINTKAKQRELF